MEPLPASGVRAGFPRKDLFAKRALDGGALSTSMVIQPSGADKGVSTAFVVAGAVTSGMVRQCVWEAGGRGSGVEGCR